MQKILEYCLLSLTCFPLNLTSYAKDTGILPSFLNLFTLKRNFVCKNTGILPSFLNLFSLKPNFVCKRYWNIAFLP